MLILLSNKQAFRVRLRHQKSCSSHYKLVPQNKRRTSSLAKREQGYFRSRHAFPFEWAAISREKKFHSKRCIFPPRDFKL